MKKIFFLVLTFTVLALFLSCVTKPGQDTVPVDFQERAKDTSLATKTIPQTQINYSFLSPKDEGKELTITGLFTKEADGTASLISNPESRSKVSFILLDSKGLLASNDAPKNGEIITITGIITNASATWKKYLELVAIHPD